MTERFPSTADIPRRFLKAAYMVGHIPQKALSSDLRISYSVYVPPKFYADETETGKTNKLRVVVYVHGTRRNTSAMHHELATFADKTSCAVVAPMFPAGLDGPSDLNSYKVLSSKTLRADLALLSILDEVARRWLEVDTEKVFLMGFSGGAQFALRFLYLYPERLAAVCLGAPGTTTLLNDEKNWPEGVGDVQTIFGRNIDKHAIGLVPIQLVVGSLDNEVHGGEEFWEWLRKQKRQGDDSKATKSSGTQKREGRLQSLKRLHEAWRDVGIDAEFHVVEDAAHEETKIRPYFIEFLQSRIQENT
ncbi:alpha/beta-hydrolase [Xylariaceae sp. FL0255]|nr:alpha/beta-hydrolase [Xylariaceae sp. FL0255]